MKMKKYCVVNEKQVWYHEFKKVISPPNYVNYCPFCNKVVKKNVIAFYTNFELFPNIMTHKECIKDNSKENIITWLYWNYKAYLEQQEKFKAWSKL